MPELCEIALTCEALRSALCGKLLLSINAFDGTYAKKGGDIEGGGQLSDRFPVRVDRIDARGKFVWFELKTLATESAGNIMNTFGLEGRWSFTKIPHSRVLFTFFDERQKTITHLWWADMCNYGTLLYSPTSDKLVAKRERLATDLLRDEHTEGGLWATLQKLQGSRKWPQKTIVQLLMDQESLCSGIGNYLAPEILYRARVSPWRTVDSIDKKTFGQIYSAICVTIRNAYLYNETRYIDHLKAHKPMLNPFPQHDDGSSSFSLSVYRKKTDPLGNKVVDERILTNRPSKTYWCPKIQS
jgi:formamidopyrimidine-DNA glycosylase